MTMSPHDAVTEVLDLDEIPELSSEEDFATRLTPNDRKKMDEIKVLMSRLGDSDAEIAEFLASPDAPQNSAEIDKKYKMLRSQAELQQVEQYAPTPTDVPATPPAAPITPVPEEPAEPLSAVLDQAGVETTAEEKQELDELESEIKRLEAEAARFEREKQEMEAKLKEIEDRKQQAEKEKWAKFCKCPSCAVHNPKPRTRAARDNTGSNTNRLVEGNDLWAQLYFVFEGMADGLKTQAIADIMANYLEESPTKVNSRITNWIKGIAYSQHTGLKERTGPCTREEAHDIAQEMENRLKASQEGLELFDQIADIIYNQVDRARLENKLAPAARQRR